MQLLVFTFTIAYCIVLSKARYLLVPNKTMDASKSAEETQHAVCKIVTKELQATANVTLTRELKGVCMSRELDEKIEELQRVLLKELHLIRKELKEEIDVSEEDTQYYWHSPQAAIQKRTVYEFADVTTFEDNRGAEVLKYNTTINSSNKGSFFYYYWKLENINEILSDMRGISVRSPSFTLLGRNFYIVLYPHHMTSKYLGIQLKSSQGPFLKHRFTIIDHISVRGDLSSQLLGDENNYAVMYRVAHDKIEKPSFIGGDMIVIKLSITLN